MLYISSAEYSYQRKNKIQKILKSKQINCIFYSINEEYFTSDFENKIKIFLPIESMEICPTSDIYVEQILVKKEEQMNYFYLL